MRLFLTCLISFFSYYSYAQQTSWDREEIFKVLFAENTINKAGQAVKNLDAIQRNDVLKVGAHGSVVLVHYGFSIEINRQGSFRADSLESLLLKTMNMKPNKKKKVKAEQIKYNYPEFDYLLIADSIKAEKASWALHGTVMDRVQDREILYPMKFFHSSVYYSDTLCIQWQTTKANSYEILIVNEFDELMFKTRVDSNYFSMAGKTLDSLKGKSELLILTISDWPKGSKNANRSLNPINLKKFGSGLPLPYSSCSFSYASAALLTALTIELDRSGHIDLAYKYYQLATQLSDKSFYKEMLSNFEKRLGSVK